MTKNKNTNSLRFGFSISMLLLVVASLSSYYSINKLIESSRWVDHTNEVLKVAENVISNIKDGETGQRGFLLTGQQDLLEPFNGSFNRTMAAMKQLRVLTKDNYVQQLNCDSLDILINKRFSILQQSIDDKNASLSLNIFLLRDGFTYMQRIRLLVQKIQHEEEKLLIERNATMGRFVRYAPIAIVAATILAIGITIVFFKQVMDDSRKKAQLAESLSEKEAETTNRIHIIQNLAGKIADGEYTIRLNEAERDGLGTLSGSLNKMASSLSQTFNELHKKEWLQTGTAELSEKIAGEKTVTEIAEESIAFISGYTNSLTGACYLANNDNSLYIAGSYALSGTLSQQRLKPGEGLPGQCFSNKKEIIVENIDDQFYTSSAAGTIKPKHLLLFPIEFERNITGVIELGSVTPFEQQDIDFLENISEILGVNINTALNRFRLKELLEETQAQAEELQAQHRELENINAELEIQAEKLQTSEEELKVQQEELLEANQELEERSHLLEEKNHMVVLRNIEIQKKAEELAQSTRYKSEFLANMSHELRTPLNSVLLLSRLLAENNPGNLTNEQVEFAQVIQSSGQGLLELIDEILDLSKIESGKTELEYEQVAITDILENIRLLFMAMAKEKNIDFTVNADAAAAITIETDKLRVEQILKNLVSNALKFTPSGSIAINASLSGKTVSFHVKDSGIGIADEKQQLIFEAFQQADGSTKRKYGGTGLGLSISRQLARLLSGDVTLKSAVGEGSTFTLAIPVQKPVKKTLPAKPEPVQEKAVIAEPVQERSPLIAKDIPDPLPDDRKLITHADKVVLIVEDDRHFAKALLDYAHQKRYKVIHCVRGDEVLDLVLKYEPMGILLDIQLPVKDGLTVMDELKKDTRTRHIPVHIMSSFEVKKESLIRGAVDFINKPVAYEQMNSILEKIEQAVHTEMKKVLIVEDNSYHAKALAYFLSTHQVNTAISDNINASISTLQKKEVNCVILDMGLPGKKGYEMLDIVKQHAELEQVPIIIFTGKSFSRTEEQKIRQYADAIVVKTAHSYQRILNEVSLFLHLVDQPVEKRTNGKGLGTLDAVLKGKTVLIADDDVRNIFALTKALEKHKMNVITAIDGKEALQQLEKEQKIDIVLMDMMMPEMDGYETIRRIRSHPGWKRLPIIAVTAKAMMEDREKCIEAGASDYISKPVDSDQLLSLMRVWLYETV